MLNKIIQSLNETDMTVANTIKDQIGGKGLYMLGAQNLVGDEKSLTFHIRGSSKVSHVRITLNGKDLYGVEFLKIRGVNMKKVNVENDVYAEDLRRVIEKNTGLRTNL
jgi:putative heme iron utilization protein